MAVSYFWIEYIKSGPYKQILQEIFQVLTGAFMKFRIVFWDVLPSKIIVDNYFTRQYIPEDYSEILQEINFSSIEKTA
jgi:hypothetical protein